MLDNIRWITLLIVVRGDANERSWEVFVNNSMSTISSLLLLLCVSNRSTITFTVIKTRTSIKKDKKILYIYKKKRKKKKKKISEDIFKRGKPLRIL